MANSLTAASQTLWSRIMGRKRYKESVAPALASYEEQATLSSGRIVDRPYRSDLAVENYTKGTAAAAQDLTATSNQLTIDKQETILMYVDDVDKLQNKWSAAKLWSEEAGKRLAESSDAEFLYEVRQAADTIDDGDIGGTAGNAIVLTTSNVANVLGKINRKLDQNNADLSRSKRFLALSPQFYDTLVAYLQGKESMLGDKTGEAGMVGKYLGLQLYMTNNLTASAVWTPANAPTANDTITISGVTFTFVDTIGSTAGNILVNGGTVAQVITRLTTHINAPGTTTANGVAFSGADLRTVQKMVAVDGTTKITVYHKGKSFLTVSGSDSNDTWTQKIQHNLAGVKGAIDMVMQMNPDIQIASTVSAGKRGTNIMPLQVYGIKTFDQGTREIFGVQIDSSNF